MMVRRDLPRCGGSRELGGYSRINDTPMKTLHMETRLLEGHIRRNNNDVP
jgi:hypothetical protein